MVPAKTVLTVASVEYTVIERDLTAELVATSIRNAQDTKQLSHGVLV